MGVELTWPGKDEARAVAERARTGPAPAWQPSGGSGGRHLFYVGDNLAALQHLLPTHAGGVDIAYLDPPYNTGSELVYDDAQGPHEAWLSLLHPRLALTRDLLADDGVLFVSIGDTEHAHLRVLLDELFGEANFLASITRVTKRSSNNGTHFSPCKDHVLAYARDKARLPGFAVPLTEAQIATYNREDDRGRFKEVGLYQAALKHGGSSYPITCPDGSRVIPPGTVPWRWNEARFERALAEDRIVFKATRTSPLIDPDTGARAAWNIYTKMHLADRLDEGLLPKDVFEDLPGSLATRELAELGIRFDFAKPVALIGRLLAMTRKRDAVVLDPFAGSGTTGHAVLALNAADAGGRTAILVQRPEPPDPRSAAAQDGYATLADLALERLRRAGEVLRHPEAERHADWDGDVGFRVLVEEAP